VKNAGPRPTELPSPGYEPADVLRPALSPSPEAALTPRNFDEIYADNFGFVWRCLRALGVPERHLDDAAQEVFIGVHRGLPSFRGGSALRTWVYAIVRNVAFKERRTRHRKERAEPMLEEPMGGGPTPHERAEEAQAADFVREFAATLGDDQRDVFVLALVEELTIPEVAQIIDVPLNTAYTRLRSVRAAFRAAIVRRGEPA